MLHNILLTFSLVCFAFAAWRHASPDWNRVVAVGWVAYVLSLLAGAF